VYFTDSSTYVQAVSLSGGLISGTDFGGKCGVMGLALDSTNIYGIVLTALYNPGGECDTNLGSGELRSAPLGGGTATTIGTSLGAVPGNQWRWRCLAVDASNAYFTNYEAETVVRISKSGGAQTILSPASDPSAPRGIAVQGANVYWGGAGICQKPVAGGALTTLAPSADGKFIAADSSYVYYIDGGAVMKVLNTGSTPVTLVPSGATGSLAIDANNVYYLGASTVMMVPKLGGTPTTLASGQTTPIDIAVDATSVYWLTPTAVMKRAL